MALKFEETAPLYQQLARHLHGEISAGTYPVGSLLPTETELAAGFGVSRQTVRQAIGELRQRGLLSARKGVGTRVEEPPSDWRARFSANSRAELFDFARETIWQISERAEVTARGALATEMGVRSGKRFYHIAGKRYNQGEETVLCYNEAYISPSHKPVLDGHDSLNIALFTLIEAAGGDRVKEIRQDIRAVPMSEEIATHLGYPAGSYCVKMTRRYYGSGRRLLEYAVQYYPAEKFSYSSTLSST
ncbi:GntR family transcriptional regulator [Thioclava sp. GXIMD2076]|uniref:GntR family transcriptional regulator n=1 Tax=Thioclava kandeliae TaxID=3070818 RepID=A0ABV1SEM2_9RHOB